MAVVHVTTDTFVEEVLKSEKPVLVDFWASWCGPCRMLAPVIDELGEELTDVKVCKIDVDSEPNLAARFKVMSIPTLVVLKDGQTVNSAIGVQSKAAILKMLGK